MKPNPKTTYATASPQTWELVRAAYLSGLSAPTVAARFGVSVTALRKRAAREGWTKAAYARVCAPAPAHLPAQAPPPATTSLHAREEAVVRRHMKPLYVDPGELSRRALMRAAEAVAEGRGLEAMRLAQAAEKVAELNAFLPRGDWYEIPEDEDLDGRTEHMRLMVRSIALNLAEKIARGEPLPAEYQTLREEREADLA